jgi:copper chaperone CopZ
MTTTDPRTTGTTHTTLRAEGFTCPSCVAKIEKRVGALPGVSNIKVQFASSRIEVDHDPQVTGVDQLVTEVAKAGYASRPAAF